VDRAEAEAIYDLGREAVVEVLLRFDARLTELEARLNASSETSSRPPSSDGLTKRPAKPRSRGSRSAGKQPGADGRFLSQVVAPDVVVEHEPGSCSTCGLSLDGASLVQTETRQVADLPPVRLVWTEHRSRRRRCSCGVVTAGVFPDQVVAPVQYGPGMRAAAAYLCSYQHVPYERARQTFRDLLGADVSVGWIVASVTRVGDAVVPSVERIADLLAVGEQIHVDETGCRVAGKLHWTHVACTDRLTHLSVNERRGRAAMLDAGILERFTGIAIHDGLHAYRSFDGCEHALCGAHHLRELDGVHEHYGQSWAHDMAELLREIKVHADEARGRGEGTLTSADIRRFERFYDELICEGWFANPPPPRTGQRGRPKLGRPGALVHRLDRDRVETLRFMRDLTVPFDNNQAERDIRPVKVKQNVSGCYRTRSGANIGALLRSYIDTARKHGENVMTALRAATNGRPWQPTTA
jgi:transposase